MTKSTFFILLAVILSVSSCRNEVAEATKGFWAIKELRYKEYDIIRCTSINVMQVEDNICVVPELYECDSFSSRDTYAEWTVIKGDSGYNVNIVSDNWVFDGLHRLVFTIDTPSNSFVMKIESENFYCLCKKTGAIGSPFMEKFKMVETMTAR